MVEVQLVCNSRSYFNEDGFLRCHKVSGMVSANRISQLTMADWGDYLIRYNESSLITTFHFDWLSEFCHTIYEGHQLNSSLYMFMMFTGICINYLQIFFASVSSTPPSSLETIWKIKTEMKLYRITSIIVLWWNFENNQVKRNQIYFKWEQ